jgi:hypothetical protein
MAGGDRRAAQLFLRLLTDIFGCVFLLLLLDPGQMLLKVILGQVSLEILLLLRLLTSPRVALLHLISLLVVLLEVVILQLVLL